MPEPTNDTAVMDNDPIAAIEQEINTDIKNRQRHIRRLRAVGDSVFHAARLAVDSALPREIVADAIELLAADVKRLEAAKAKLAPSIFEEPPPAQAAVNADEALVEAALAAPNQTHPPRPNLVLGKGKPK